MSVPQLYAVPPGADFARTFAQGFWQRHGSAAPDTAAQIRIFVNTPRALRLIEDALVETASGSALLPRLSVLGDLGADPLTCPEIPPAIDPHRRHLRLTRLVEAFLKADPDRAVPISAAPDLAEGLAALLDEFDDEGLDATYLDDAVAAEHADHWQRTLAFVDLVRERWPEIRAELEGGARDPKARQRAVVMALAEAWSRRPPPAPVIAAGSTGTVSSTAHLLAAIARLEQGGVVLPGFDRDLPADIWNEIGEGHSPEHPQAPFARLLEALGMVPGDVAPWTGAASERPRLRLLTQALRPAPVTDAWHAAAAGLAPEAAFATAGLTLIEAGSPRHEAAAIALAIRRGLAEPDRRIALVTPDATLARRVSAELERFNIEPDDSLGQPLALTPPGIFLRLIARIVATGADPVDLAGLLKHPLTRPRCDRAAHLGLARRYERAILRRGGIAGGGPGDLPPWPGADPDAAAWLARISDALAGLGGAIKGGASLAVIAAHHRAAAEALSRDWPEAGPAVWEGRAGEAAAAAIAHLESAADAYGDGPVEAYAALFDAHLKNREVRPDPIAPHPRVAILGPREARSHPANLLILGGLNEGTWPALPGPEPWLNRPLRAALGLPTPERRIGLSAHDFYAMALRPEVVLTRARKVDGTPCVASRWLIRLETLLGGLDEGRALDEMRARGAELLGAVALVHRPAAPVPRAERPMPSPAIAARPRRLSVTQIETLIRDAYAIYARKILALEPLDPVGRPLDHRDRGKVLHTVLERFVGATANRLPPHDEARALLMETAERVLADLVPWPDLRRIWRARIARFADWFLEGERRRRAAGVPVAREVPGQITLAAPEGAFTLTARADRIDLLHEGGAAIYDYKSGAPPSSKQIKQGFNHQLHIQAAILAAGGFDGLPEIDARIGAYLGLTGAPGTGGKMTEVPDLSSEVAEHMERLDTLIAAYDAGAPYTARGLVQTLDQEGEYDHLSRRAEWEGVE